MTKFWSHLLHPSDNREKWKGNGIVELQTQETANFKLMVIRYTEEPNKNIYIYVQIHKAMNQSESKYKMLSNNFF